MMCTLKIYTQNPYKENSKNKLRCWLQHSGSEWEAMTTQDNVGMAFFKIQNG